jgi:O-methyltransferase involved in polyketide biosynthesis
MVSTDATRLGAVQKTLLLPLWGRAVESRKPAPLLVDVTAVRIIDSTAYDFSTIAANISFISQLAWIARSLHIDRIIRQFLGRFPLATIVNNGTLRWYDLDLPDVIELRSQYLEEGPRRKFVACSILDDLWMSRVEIGEAVLFVAAGVLYYFEENELKTLFRRITDRFPGSAFVADVCSPRGVKIANEKVIRGGGMSSDAQLKWGLSKAAEIHGWDERISVLAEFPIFSGFKRRFSLKQKWGAFLSDALRIMSMVHLRMGQKD